MQLLGFWENQSKVQVLCASSITYLVGGIVVLLEVRMGERLLDRDPVVRVKGEHLAEQVKRVRVGVCEQPRPGHLRFVRQRLQVAAGLLVDDALEVLLRGRPEHAEDVVQLVQVVLAGEDGPVAEHLRQYAADGPDVDGLGVTLERKGTIDTDCS